MRGGKSMKNSGDESMMYESERDREMHERSWTWFRRVIFANSLPFPTDERMRHAGHINFSSPSLTGPSPSSTELETLVEDREVEEPCDSCREGWRENKEVQNIIETELITPNSLQSTLSIKREEWWNSPVCDNPSPNKHTYPKIDNRTLCKSS